jgi:VCBS repeat protein
MIRIVESGARRSRYRAVACAAVAMWVASSASAAEPPFAIQTLSLGGRVVQADLADLDGDGRGDLLCVRFDGLPPAEKRALHVFYQRPDRTFPATSDWSAPLPAGAGAYDLADLDGRPGEEIVLLRRDRLTVISLAGRTAASRDLPLATEPTLAMVADERGLDRLQMVRTGLAKEVRLLVPGLGWAEVLTPSGESLGHLDVGARANYLIPKRPGPVISESEVEVYFDHPRLTVGDVDGDGRGDIVSANRHELRVFLQDEQGHFPSRPSRTIALGLITIEDHVRNSGNVRVDGADLDNDGRLDLLISHSVGSLISATTTLSIYMNRNGGWDLAHPTQQFRTEKGFTANVVVDLDGDGLPELVEAKLPTGVLEIVEVLVTRTLDAEVSIYRHGQEKPFDPKPWQRWTVGVAISFETFRSRGFVPTLEADFNGDGVKDLLGSGDGDRLEVSLGGSEEGYQKRTATQPLDTGGRIRFADLDGDGLTDFVLYDGRRPGTPVLIGINRGTLPQTGKSIIGPSPAPSAPSEPEREP